MSSARIPPATPATAEHIKRAYRRLAKPHWPAFEAALEAPILGRLIRGLALRLANPLGASQQQPTPLPRLRALPAVDWKRRAAGDIDTLSEEPANEI